MKGDITVSLKYKKKMPAQYEMLDIEAGLTVQVADVYSKDEWAKAWDQVDTELSAKLEEAANG